MRNNYTFKYRKTSKLNINKFQIIVIIAIFMLIWQFFYYAWWVTPGVDLKNSVQISIKPGDSLKSIANQLKDKNVINSTILFYLEAKKTGMDSKVQSGVFDMPLPQNVNSALQILTSIPVEDKLVIPEGYKISQIDEMLFKKGLIKKGEFIDCVKNCEFKGEILNEIPVEKRHNLEGFLFPDTYFINSKNFKVQSLIQKMIDNFETKIPLNVSEKLRDLPVKTLYEVIIMASIIEREVRSSNDMQIVSGILWKRFKSNWSLDADATLLYEKDNNIITLSDLKKDSLYNTRKFRGLPPTPISNPGVKSIIASLNPIETPYWFYLTTLDTGKVIYSKTLDEHNVNKYKYLR